MNLKFGKINTVLDMAEEFRTLLTPSSTILRNTKKPTIFFMTFSYAAWYDFYVCIILTNLIS